jgi:hypothetical protein
MSGIFKGYWGGKMIIEIDGRKATLSITEEKGIRLIFKNENNILTFTLITDNKIRDILNKWDNNLPLD